MADSSWYTLYIFLQTNDRGIMISSYASVSHLFQCIKSTETYLNVTTHIFIVYFCYIQDEEWRVNMNIAPVMELAWIQQEDRLQNHFVYCMLHEN